MNENKEKEYWSRVVGEVLEMSGLTLEELATRMGVSDRQVSNWRLGQRPSGIVAIRFYEFRRGLFSKVGIVLHGHSTGDQAIS